MKWEVAIQREGETEWVTESSADFAELNTHGIKMAFKYRPERLCPDLLKVQSSYFSTHHNYTRNIQDRIKLDSMLSTGHRISLEILNCLQKFNAVLLLSIPENCCMELVPEKIIRKEFSTSYSHPMQYCCKVENGGYFARMLSTILDMPVVFVTARISQMILMFWLAWFELLGQLT